MNDQFPPPGWSLRPENWMYRLPGTVFGRLPASWAPQLPPVQTSDSWDQSTSTGSSSDAPSGILGQFSQPLDPPQVNPWSQATGPATWNSPTLPGSSASAASATSTPQNGLVSKQPIMGPFGPAAWRQCGILSSTRGAGLSSLGRSIVRRNRPFALGSATSVCVADPAPTGVADARTRGLVLSRCPTRSHAARSSEGLSEAPAGSVVGREYPSLRRSPPL
jgi:hypothetical protein